MREKGPTVVYPQPSIKPPGFSPRLTLGSAKSFPFGGLLAFRAFGVYRGRRPIAGGRAEEEVERRFVPSHALLRVRSLEILRQY